MSLKDNVDEIFLSHLHHSTWNKIPESFQYKDKILNKLCGDEIFFYMNYQLDHFEEIFFNSESCSISKVSTSILLDEINHKSFEHVLELIKEFKIKFLNSEKLNSKLDYLFKFRNYPTRYECVFLPFHFIEKFILGAKKNGIK